MSNAYDPLAVHDDPQSTAYDPLATSEEDHSISKDARTPYPPTHHPTVFSQIHHFAARWIYNPLGFKKFYNFLFFFILGGALFFFGWYNIRMIDVNGYWIKHTQQH